MMPRRWAALAANTSYTGSRRGAGKLYCYGSRSVTDEELIEAWQWVKDHFGNERAQRVALRMLEKPPYEETPLRYAKFLLRCELGTERAPNFEGGKGGKLRRIKRESPLSDEMLETLAQRGSADGQATIRLELAERRKTQPQRVKAALNGGERKAECHPDKKHYAKGLCKACHQRQLYLKDPDRINAKRRARYEERQSGQPSSTTSL